MTVEDDIQFEIRGKIALVTLNRPKALNALTQEMCVALKAQLEDWDKDKNVAAVVIEGTGEKAFCAGGDIVRLYNEGRAKGDYPYQFYRDEYLVNAAIKHFSKPYIALIDGIVMGGGVGVSVHGSQRIATENTLFAMPETGIGLFPDVGGSYFLPRCPGKLGLYLGLTGARLKAADAVYAGIATAYVPASRLEDLKAALADGATDADAVSQIISDFRKDPGTAPLAEIMGEIDRFFEAESMLALLTGLEEAEGSAFARDTAKLLRKKSPTALRLTFDQLSKGATLDFDDCMRMEFRMVNRVIQGLDFYEGTRATVIDKDQRPLWNPANLEAVGDAEIADYFAPLDGGELY
ncbi:MAG: enoyl-CoA hydratase/isomerase family protein [Alphaproteobacteria bacterium]|nr:MAG: enoyl-CoA hydratase/isomerase family protein [Alphaproteobacteria bacterium]